jgi:hypothetical protein
MLVTFCTRVLNFLRFVMTMLWHHESYGGARALAPSQAGIKWSHRFNAVCLNCHTPTPTHAGVALPLVWLAWSRGWVS